MFFAGFCRMPDVRDLNWAGDVGSDRLKKFGTCATRTRSLGRRPLRWRERHNRRKRNFQPFSEETHSIKLLQLCNGKSVNEKLMLKLVHWLTIYHSKSVVQLFTIFYLFISDPFNLPKAVNLHSCFKFLVGQGSNQQPCQSQSIILPLYCWR